MDAEHIVTLGCVSYPRAAEFDAESDHATITLWDVALPSSNMATLFGPVADPSGSAQVAFVNAWTTSAGQFTLTNMLDPSSGVAAIAPSAVPEPASLSLFGVAGLGLLAARRRKRAKQAA